MSDADGHHWSDASFGMAFGLPLGWHLDITMVHLNSYFWFGGFGFIYTSEPIPGRLNRVRCF